MNNVLYPETSTDNFTVANDRVHAQDVKYDAQLSLEIGCKVRSLRKRQQLTATELAGAAGLSFGMLSKIEHGTISPSLRTLQALAQALCVPITHLFEDANRPRHAQFTKAGSQYQRDDSGRGRRTESRGAYTHTLEDGFVLSAEKITASKSYENRMRSSFKGFECIYMITGQMRYVVDEKFYDISGDDYLTFNANLKHGCDAIISESAEYLKLTIRF